MGRHIYVNRPEKRLVVLMDTLTENEKKVRRLDYLIETAKKYRIKALFVEEELKNVNISPVLQSVYENKLIKYTKILAAIKEEETKIN